MSQPIRDVLHRRTDLSTFVVHLTRERYDEEKNDWVTARQSLEAIMKEGRLRAQRPMGWAKEQDEPDDPSKQSQRVVCFSEVPLEHIYSLVLDIEGRQIKLRPYGLAMTKLTARKLGVNPVWYVDMTPGQEKQWVLRNAIEALRDEAIANTNFHEQEIANLTPFVEQMGTWSQESKKEWWWEREWRHVGNLSIPFRKVIWLCPEDEMDSIREATEDNTAHMIDPRWGLEQIIAHLAGFAPEDVTPFEAK